MEKMEIAQCLSIGGPLLVCVDIREAPDFPGFVRTVTIYRDLSVEIAYELCTLYIEDDMEGPDVAFRAEYATLNDAIEDLEDFLSCGHLEWKNYTLERYNPREILGNITTQTRLVQLATNRKLPLPVQGKYELTT